MSSPFNPRDVEVLAAALPPQGANPIGRATRALLAQFTKRYTPGRGMGLDCGKDGSVLRDAFFRDLNDPRQNLILPTTGLDIGFFTDGIVVLICAHIAAVSRQRGPRMDTVRIDAALAAWNDTLRKKTSGLYAAMLDAVDSPIRSALNAFPTPAAKAEAGRHYLAGITSASWVNAKILQDASHNWPDRDWELFHHWVKLSALGVSAAEIDAAIRTVTSMGLPVPASLGPEVWRSRTPWLEADLSAADVAESSSALLATAYCFIIGMNYPQYVPESNAIIFTNSPLPGNAYLKQSNSSCFAPGTRVIMADRTLRPIEQVKPGDLVHTPAGPRAVLLRPDARRGDRVLERFEGTDFAFAASHPFVLAPGPTSAGAGYAAADPGTLARTIPTLGQYGIRPLGGPEPAILWRSTSGADEPFPAPATHPVPQVRPHLLHDLVLEPDAEGRSEYYAGDESVQVLVSSEIPRFAAAPETTAVVLYVLEHAGPAILAALAPVPDDDFAGLLAQALDILGASLMSAVGRQLGGPAAPAAPTETAHPETPWDPAEFEDAWAAAADADTADPPLPNLGTLADTVRAFAASVATGGAPGQGDYNRRAGTLFEAFTGRFAPQFQAALSLPWRDFDLADAEVANFLAVTVYSVELFHAGPSPAEGAEIEVALVRGPSRCARRLPVHPGAPADRWYYSVDADAYFPEWSPPEREHVGEPGGIDHELWQIEISLPAAPSAAMRLLLPRDIVPGYQAFQAPLLDQESGTVAGLANLDVRLLTLEAFTAETQTRAHHLKTLHEDPEQATADLRRRTTRLAQLATRYTTHRIAGVAALVRRLN